MTPDASSVRSVETAEAASGGEHYAVVVLRFLRRFGRTLTRPHPVAERIGLTSGGMWGSGSKANPLGVNMGRDEIEHETHEEHESS